jgi:serpin B
MGETAGAFAKVRHRGADGEAGAAAVMKRLNPAGKGTERPFSLTVANALWVHEHFPVLPTYRAALEKTFGVADAFPVDFAGKPEAARGSINGWVEEQTHKKIRDLVPAGGITPQTKVVLTNAIYFKASWMTDFPVSGTQDAPFHAAGGKNVTVPLMHLRHSFAYQETDDAQVVSLPYKTGERGESDLEMVVVLPKKADGLAAVEKGMTPKGVAGWAAGGKFALVNLSLPRFKTTSTLGLKKPLEALGLGDAFTEKADFSGIAAARSADEKLRISDVLHKAYVSVDEHGTEAAAATAVMMGTMAMPVAEPVEMRVDHPFLFLIEEKGSGVVLFVGRVGDPTKG